MDVEVLPEQSTDSAESTRLVLSLPESEDHSGAVRLETRVGREREQEDGGERGTHVAGWKRPFQARMTLAGANAERPDGDSLGSRTGSPSGRRRLAGRNYLGALVCTGAVLLQLVALTVPRWLVRGERLIGERRVSSSISMGLFAICERTFLNQCVDCEYWSFFSFAPFFFRFFSFNVGFGFEFCSLVWISLSIWMKKLRAVLTLLAKKKTCSTTELYFFQQSFYWTQRFDPESRAFFGYTSKLSNVKPARIRVKKKRVSK